MSAAAFGRGRHDTHRALCHRAAVQLSNGDRNKDYPHGREAVLLAIVDRLGMADGKIDVSTGSGVVTSSSVDPGWLLAAFKVARECLDGAV